MAFVERLRQIVAKAVSILVYIIIGERSLGVNYEKIFVGKAPKSDAQVAAGRRR